jgi:hypothetical protein
MPQTITAAHWRERAEEARSLAGHMTSDEARRAMLGVARNYDMLAEYAERLQNAQAKGTAPTSD